ncbi:MAG: hypothetical protein JXB03_09575 [Spirochaetales bacterium]|nr:hypothetical protein [Spirochaetales bacterium]
MKLGDVVKLLGCSVHNEPPGWQEREAGAVFAGDLMSDVLVHEGEATLLLTALNSDQVIRTADIVDACGVILVNNKIPQKSIIALAAETGMPLFSSPLSLYRCCADLGNAGSGD